MQEMPPPQPMRPSYPNQPMQPNQPPYPGQPPYPNQPMQPMYPNQSMYPNQQMYPGQVGQQKDWLTTLLLCFFLGYLGIHSFYTGRTTIGVIQLLTFGGCGIWALVDFIMILTDSYRDGNGLPLLKK